MEERRRKKLAFAHRLFVPHVHDAHRRQRGARRTHGEAETSRAAFAHQRFGFEARGRRSENEGRTFDIGAHPGDVARDVARMILLFERAFVFFVEDDETDVGKRGEESGARTEGDAHFSRAQRFPLTSAGAVGLIRVEDGHAAEACAEAFDRLRRQRDFRARA
jgi:hypothetical protein